MTQSGRGRRRSNILAKEKKSVDPCHAHEQSVQANAVACAKSELELERLKGHAVQDVNQAAAYHVQDGAKLLVTFGTSHMMRLRVTYLSPSLPAPSVLADFGSDMPEAELTLPEQTVDKQGRLFVEGRTGFLGLGSVGQSGTTAVAATLELKIKVAKAGTTLLKLNPSWRFDHPPVGSDVTDPIPTQSYAVSLEYTFST
jgi:hypothetical protein